MAERFWRSRLSWGKQVRLVERCVAGATARTAVELVGVNPTAAAFHFHRLCQLIEQASVNDSPLSGEILVAA